MPARFEQPQEQMPQFVIQQPPSRAAKAVAWRLAVSMQLHGLFPLTLALSPGERELLSAGRDLSLNGEPFPAQAAMPPLPTGRGRRTHICVVTA